MSRWAAIRWTTLVLYNLAALALVAGWLMATTRQATNPDKAGYGSAFAVNIVLGVACAIACSLAEGAGKERQVAVFLSVWLMFLIGAMAWVLAVYPSHWPVVGLGWLMAECAVDLPVALYLGTAPQRHSRERQRQREIEELEARLLP